MLQLLQPIWLAAMAGIAIPVIVHLWNLRRGKVLKIGSVALLTEASRRLAWSRRITQWWLLVVRCLLLAALAFFAGRAVLGEAGCRGEGMGADGWRGGCEVWADGRLAGEGGLRAACAGG